MVLASALSQVGLINDELYQVDSILEYSWGYDQTNIEYFKVISRKGLWLTMQKVPAKNVEVGDMCGKCVPDMDAVHGKIIRRRLCSRDGVAIGCNGSEDYGWMRAWDGKPSGWTTYA